MASSKNYLLFKLLFLSYLNKIIKEYMKKVNLGKYSKCLFYQSGLYAQGT